MHSTQCDSHAHGMWIARTFSQLKEGDTFKPVGSGKTFTKWAGLLVAPDMEARAQQHAEQIVKGSSQIFVRVNGTPYPVPLNVTNTVQFVLDYMNEHYYISVLVPNCSVMKLIKSGKSMDPLHTLADYGVLNEDTLHAMCVMPAPSQNGGKRTKRTSKHYNRRSKSKSKKNGHKRN